MVNRIIAVIAAAVVISMIPENVTAEPVETTALVEKEGNAAETADKQCDGDVVKNMKKIKTEEQKKKQKTGVKNNAEKKSKKSTNTTRHKKQKKKIYTQYARAGKTLTKRSGVFYGPSGKETYYNLNMKRVVNNMHKKGLSKGKYWIRRDGVKMLGDYIIVAADLKKYRRGSIVKTSLGHAIVCDTGSFVGTGTALDIAVTW